METYQSLSNRVASMEDLLRRSESSMVSVLQRLKVLEEHVSASGARHRGEATARDEELTSRMNRALENQNSKMDLLQAVTSGHTSALQVLEERLKGTFRGLEEKMNSGVAGCYQRMQSSETALASALRNVESQLHTQSSAMKSLEQILRGDIQSLQQHTRGEILGMQQRTDAQDSVLRSSLTELHKSMSADINSLSNTFHGNLQSSIRSVESSLVGLDQKVQTELRSLHDSMAHDISALRQGLTSQEVSTQDGLRALHATVAGDITDLASRQQVSEAAHQLSHQQLLAELSAQQKQLETVEANWKSSLLALGEKVQEGWKNLYSQLTTADLNLQQRLSQLNGHIEELSAQLRRTAENFSHTLDAKVRTMELIREDVMNNKRTLSGLQDEQHRLHEQLRGFSVMVERSGTQLRAIMEAAVRASHGDLLERIKPLTSYRSEMQAAITAALNRLWGEANKTFTPMRDIDALQSQIQVLDSAVRNEVSLLVERGRALERQTENSSKRENAENDNNTARLNPETGALVQMPVIGEINNVWSELCSIQKRLGMPREDVISSINEARNQILDATLGVAKKNENEFRGILSHIQDDVNEIISRNKKIQAAAKGNYEMNPVKKPRRTVLRVLSKRPSDSPAKNELPSIVKVKKPQEGPSTIEIHPKRSPLRTPREGNISLKAATHSRPGATEATGNLPPLIHCVPPPELIRRTSSASIRSNQSR